MTKKFTSQLVSKAIFAIGIVAIAGIVGAVHFAQAAPDDQSSGYGTSGGQAVAAADTFEASLVSYTNSLTDNTGTCEQNAFQTIQSSGVADIQAFNSGYDQATDAYSAAVSQAFDSFRDQVTADASTATSKDQFIDGFNHAKADYLNAIDAAKNQLADSLSQLDNNTNVAKDQFIDCFNSNRDAYSNQLEQAKNDFAATISNL